MSDNLGDMIQELDSELTPVSMKSPGYELWDTTLTTFKPVLKIVGALFCLFSFVTLILYFYFPDEMIIDPPSRMHSFEVLPGTVTTVAALDSNVSPMTIGIKRDFNHAEFENFVLFPPLSTQGCAFKVASKNQNFIYILSVLRQVIHNSNMMIDRKSSLHGREQSKDDNLRLLQVLERSDLVTRSPSGANESMFKSRDGGRLFLPGVILNDRGAFRIVVSLNQQDKVIETSVPPRLRSSSSMWMRYNVCFNSASAV